MYRYKSLILAGTFDHFHLGHKFFITKALKHCQKAYIGITTNWTKKNYFSSLQPYKTRLSCLNNFLIKKKFLEKTTIFPLNNPYGPAIKNSKLDAIAATKENLNMAILINKKRKQRKLKSLSIIKIPLVTDQINAKISSTRIRMGQINRTGLVYFKFLKHSNSLHLPINQRHHFQSPIGKLILGSNQNLSWAGIQASNIIKKRNSNFIVTVGDISTQTLLNQKIRVNLAIVDYLSQRQPIKFNLHKKLKNKASQILYAKNPPSTISKSAVLALNKALLQFDKNKQKVIKIKGEEDLIVLPTILLAPLGTIIFYGQPHQGLVKISVTEKQKEKTTKLLKKFKPSPCQGQPPDSHHAVSLQNFRSFS